MTTEGVKIVIEADYKGGDKIRQSGKDLDNTGKAAKELTGKTKASVEMFGALANTVGGGWLGQTAGEVAMLSERMGAFTDVTAESEFAMTAFKGTVVLTAAAVGIKFANSMGHAIFQTQKWKDALEEALAFADKLEGRSLGQVESRFQEQLAGAEGLSGKQRLDALQAILDRRLKESQGTADQLRRAKERLELLEEVGSNRGVRRRHDEQGNLIRGGNIDDEGPGLRKAIEQLETRLESERDRAQEVRLLIRDQREGFQDFIRKLPVDMARGFQDELRKAFEKDQQRKEAEQRRVADGRRRQLDQRNRERGRDARNQLKGVFNDMLGGAGAIGELLNSPLKKNQQQTTFQPSPLQNTENRFLQTGRSLEASPVKVTAENTKKMVEDNKSIIGLLTEAVGILPSLTGGMKGV